MGGPELTGPADALGEATGAVDGDVDGVGPQALMARTASTLRHRLANDENIVSISQFENESQRILVEIQCQIRSGGLSSKVMSTASIDTRLAAGGRRRTAQRVIVAEALASARRALSAQELYERIRAVHPTVGRATVYRALEQQVEDGMASRFEREGHVSAYIACDAEHHHHLVCTSCQRVEDVAEDVVAPMLAAVGRRHDFKVDHAALDFYGLCASCRRRGRR
jgi:Fur family ferric uptake transcriptional regulator